LDTIKNHHNKRGIYVIGYYNHHNLGDEQYRITFTTMFERYLADFQFYTLHFLHCDDLDKHTFTSKDVIILGGGDVLNDTFLDAISRKFRGKTNKVLAVSVGIPYMHIVVDTKKLAIIDFVFLRTQQEMGVLQEYFTPQRVFYLPDISYFLINEERGDVIAPNVPEAKTGEYASILQTLRTVKSRHSKKILCISLNRNIYHPAHTLQYDTFVHGFAKCVIKWIHAGFFCVFLPFNTCHISEPDSNVENDTLIHTDVIRVMGQQGTLESEHLVQNTLNIHHALRVTEVMALYPFFYATVPMHFHACLFSTYFHVPMLPIYTSKKVRNLLFDIGWTHSYPLPVNENNVPVHFNVETLMSKMNEMLILIKPEYFMWKQLPSPLEITLSRACYNFDLYLKDSMNTLMTVVQMPYKKVQPMVEQPHVHTVVTKLVKHLNFLAANEGCTDFRQTQGSELRKLMEHVSSYYLTKNFDSSYNAELQATMFHPEFDPTTAFVRFYKMHQGSHHLLPSLSLEQGLFNINYVDQREGELVHRSGWQFVFDHIHHLHSDTAEIKLDLSIDKTFHWRRTAYQSCGLIPYETPWLGVLHHTLDTTFSPYNTRALFELPLFLSSLPACRGIIVFSRYLKTQVEFLLKQHSFYSVPVHLLTHPTERHAPLFTWKKFLDNPDKLVLHVGGWYRHIMSFYQLTLPSTTVFEDAPDKVWKCGNRRVEGSVRKVILQGHKMNNYLPSSRLTETINDALLREESDGSDTPGNNWNRHFIQYLERTMTSVEVSPCLDNEEYDTWLAQNVVFLHLIDASAVNTVLECIVRHTPIIINRNPAIVEMLGEAYPLYFDSFSLNDPCGFVRMCNQVMDMWEKPEVIYRAHVHLRKMDKRRFDIQYFVAQLSKLVPVPS
jgi:hypothetical protein